MDKQSLPLPFALPPAIDDAELAAFSRRVKTLTGIDLGAYKTEQLKRRLNAAQSRLRVKSLGEVLVAIERDSVKLEEFRDTLTINVSEFFRDAEKFRYLEERVLPELAKSSRRLSVWSAGCSIGAEPYSIAMILSDQMPRGGFRVLGTDLDKRSLEQARSGSGYRPADVRAVSPERLAKYFRQSGESWSVVESVHRLVEFRQQNLLADPFERGFDLVVCRNVVIYFTDQAKDIVFNRLAAALREGGVLFIGATETLGRTQSPYFTSITPGFYRRNGVAVS